MIPTIKEHFEAIENKEIREALLANTPKKNLEVKMISLQSAIVQVDLMNHDFLLYIINALHHNHTIEQAFDHAGWGNMDKSWMQQQEEETEINWHITAGCPGGDECICPQIVDPREKTTTIDHDKLYADFMNLQEKVMKYWNDNNCDPEIAKHFGIKTIQDGTLEGPVTNKEEEFIGRTNSAGPLGAKTYYHCHKCETTHFEGDICPHKDTNTFESECRELWRGVYIRSRADNRAEDADYAVEEYTKRWKG